MIRVLPRCKPSRPAWADAAGVDHAPPEQPRARHAGLRREAGVRGTRGQAGHPHSRAADLLGRGLGERQYACFRRAVSGLVRAGLESGCGGDIQDRTVPSTVS